MFNRYFLSAIISLLSLANDSAMAQSSNESGYPVIGKPCPYFSFNNVVDSEEKEINLKKLKGKPFILDFFSTGCTMCFASFPKIDKLNKEFSGKVRFLIIGLDDKYIRPSYNTYKKRLNLDLPHVFDSSILAKFGITAFPYVVWVNAQGIVVAITTSPDITESNVTAFEMGQSFPYNDLKESLSLYLNFDTHKPFLMNGNGGDSTAFFQRTLFAEWKKNMGNAGQTQVENFCKQEIPLQVVGWPLSSLYKLAYFNKLADWSSEDTVYYGKYHYSPIYEMADSSQFIFDWNTEINKFCYSQILPKDRSTPENMRRIMKDDLYNAFGYQANIEVKKMPYLRLIMNSEKRYLLQSKGGDMTEDLYPGGFSLQNGSVSELINVVSYKAGLVSKDLPLIDETGINYPIDINFDAVMTDLNDVKNELSKYGLQIMPGIKNMNVLVIRDKENISKN